VWNMLLKIDFADRPLCSGVGPSATAERRGNVYHARRLLGGVLQSLALPAAQEKTLPDTGKRTKSEPEGSAP
jgi:hypothetical protein